jgi:uncharacterized protein YyaL (SSP411 family)
MKKYTNALVHQSSPYLLQHAHNPVDWVPWSDDVFKRAKDENKLVLISIGYSSCHWCHVMEHECFEDEEVAELMNRHFINVKVDREERPDVDQVYMTAVQLMTQRGGWPLNCFTLPDGRPVYGGTYFPKEQWMHILGSLNHTWLNDPKRALEYAEKLSEGIQLSELIQKPAIVGSFEEERLHELVLRWSRNFDTMEGGNSRAPKFPLPNNYEFLLRYGVEFGDQKILRHVELTLDKMAMGGIYDQIGGGFTRYSVDMLWKVPHFEKMLYDNGQLLSLYAQAYKYFRKPLYKRTILGMFEWLEREMKSDEGAYYSALDADSEGEEGKFYCWAPEEMERLTGADYRWVKEFYNLNQRGFWEEGKFIPLRTASDREFAFKMGWTEEELEDKILKINSLLLKERSTRVRPGLDDKCLTAWNAMALKGLSDAYAALGDQEFLHAAGRIARWIRDHQVKEVNRLWRTRKNRRSTIEAFLEDYAHVIEAFISFYSVTFDEQWIDLASKLSETVLKEFGDDNSGMCWFTHEETTLIARKMEINDNVIPSSNSVMAHNFRKLGELYYRKDLGDRSRQMLANVYDGMEQYGSGYSNWALLLMDYVCTSYVVAITGTGNTEEKAQGLRKVYLPEVLLTGGKKASLPVLEDKAFKATAHFQVCYEGTCLLPTDSVDEVIQLIRRN